MPSELMRFDDAVGNLTDDSLHTYTGACPERSRRDTGPLRIKRVYAGVTGVYIYSGSKLIAVYANGAPDGEYIYAGSTRVAQAYAGTAYYYHPDHLDERVLTDSSGGAIWLGGHYPFGENWYELIGGDGWRFTSYLRDFESGVDYANFRYYSSRLGRFMQADRLAGDIVDPQSLNRYAYAQDDPCNSTDPLGLATCKFNIQFNNAANLSDAQVQEIEQRINEVFSQIASPNGDTVGINFGFSGTPDSTITIYKDANWFVNSVLNYPTGIQGGLFMLSPRVYWNNTPAPGAHDAGHTANAGNVGAHELAHVWLGGDQDFDPRNMNNMMFDKAPSDTKFDAFMHPTTSPLWRFTAAQIAALYQKCKKARGNTRGPLSNVVADSDASAAWFSLAGGNAVSSVENCSNTSSSTGPLSDCH